VSAREARLGLLALAVAAASCNAIVGNETPTLAPGPSDAGNEDDGAGGATYNDFTDKSLWKFYDTSIATTPRRVVCVGVTFDGRFVYFAPNGGASASNVLRYDTTGDFSTAASWATFDTTTVAANAKNFWGGAFDGKYAYFPPVGATPAARFDTSASFGNSSSWSTFDMTTLTADASGFSGAVFDGHYVYFIPNDPTSPHSVVVRHDPKGAQGFGSPSSWQTFDASTINSRAINYSGAVFDGRYLYFAQSRYGTDSGFPLRYDTHASFTDGASWTTVDVHALTQGTAYVGVAFDGHYAYFVPDADLIGTSGRVLRYDTTASFADIASWSAFDAGTLKSTARGFAGSAFDGRYIYLVPFKNAAGSDGVLTRYDTQGDFGSSDSWSIFDITTLNARARGFIGAAFDGEYLYLVPASDTVVARFDAKTPPSLPPGYSGSFF
jgi:hypothetical protein